MRIIRRLVLLLVLLGAGLWFLAEFALVQGARKLAADGVIGLDRAEMLADPRRVGARLEGVTFGGSGTTQADIITLSDAVIWVAPWRPNQLHVDLPARVTFPAPDTDPIPLNFAEPHLQARFFTAHRMGLVAAMLRLDGAQISDQPLAGPARLTLNLIASDQEFAGQPAAAYRVDVDITQLHLPALAPFLTLPDPPEGDLSATGAVTVWLDDVIGPLSDPAQLRGFGVTGAEIRLDDAVLRVSGQIGVNAEGEAEGLIVFDSTDLRGFVLALRDAGLVPPKQAHLIATALETIARESRKSAPEFMPQPQTGHIIPPPEDGDERVPLHFAEGEVYLGDVPLGGLLSPAE